MSAAMRVLMASPGMQAGDKTDRRLREAGFETVVSPTHASRSEEELIRLVKGIDGALAGIDNFTARVLAAADRLKVVACRGAGWDSVDVEAATARGIVVCANPGVNRRAVAEYTFALMLQCSRKMVESLSVVPRGGWGWLLGSDLAGKTLGIVGLGAIGKEVAKRAVAFEMRVLATVRTPDVEFAARYPVAYVPLEQLLRESDFVTLHPYLDARSHHLIDAQRLALMKPTAWLINTSRGAVVDTEALVRALREKRIAGAALDAFEREPLEADSPLRGFSNVYLSPHGAGATSDAREASADLVAENVIRVLRGERPHFVVNPEVLERGGPERAKGN